MNSETMIKIPLNFRKMNTLPTDPINSVAYGNQTQFSNMFLMMYPILNQDAMPYGNEKAIIDGIHSALSETQGLVEVKSGITKNQKRYIYSIVKTQLNPSGIQYVLTMHVDMNNQTMHIQAFFDEAGMTGLRDTTIMNKMINEGKITPPNIDDWFKDPYDENYKRGLLKNESENSEYDVMFPQHPLSEMRNLIKFIIDNN